MYKFLLILALAALPVRSSLALTDSVALSGRAHARLPSLAAAHEDAMLQTLYARAGTRPLWIEHGRPTPQATELLRILATADTFGLRTSDYGVEVLATARNASQGTATQFDALLSRAAIRLVTHLHYGRIDPRTAGFELQGSRTDLDVVSAVAALASTARVADALAAVEPHFYHYRLLKTALAHYRLLAAEPSLTQLPGIGHRALHIGDTYVGEPALRRLLMALGDLSDHAQLSPLPSSTATSPDAPPSPDALQLDAALCDALKRFQLRHGLPTDGALNGATYLALTTPLAQRVRQIELTLERWRWLPAFDTPPIIVNIPEFRLFAFNSTEDRVADIRQMAVIVGQTYARTRTPVFVGDMRYVIFRPYWNVPRSITVHEMLPKIQANTEYLRRNNLEIVRGEGDDATAMSPTPAVIAALAAGQLRLRQQPGEDNALGLVKFMFPNSHNVYLHSTPAHQLFAQSRRAFSHGCIRVSDPAALAAYVLRNAAGTWDAARIDAAMRGANSSRVELLKPIRVMILYGTALATEAGPVEFFNDIYGHDRKLAQLLAIAHSLGSSL